MSVLRTPAALPSIHPHLPIARDLVIGHPFLLQPVRLGSCSLCPKGLPLGQKVSLIFATYSCAPVPPSADTQCSLQGLLLQGLTLFKEQSV